MPGVVTSPRNFFLDDLHRRRTFSHSNVLRLYMNYYSLTFENRFFFKCNFYFFPMFYRTLTFEKWCDSDF